MPRLRNAIPLAARWRIRALRRAIADRRAGVTFADARGDANGFPHGVCAYERRLVCYPGQEAAFAAKRANIARSLAAVDATLIPPGATFSFWRLVGRPTRARGYAPAAAIRGGVLGTEVGGAVCLASTLLFNVALLAGMEITERQCHSIDSYGDARYFELGRDAAVEHPYIDLRFRNPHDVSLLLRARASGDTASAEMLAPRPRCIDVAIEAYVVESTRELLRLHARRIVTHDGAATVDEWESVHRPGAHPG